MQQSADALAADLHLTLQALAQHCYASDMLRRPHRFVLRWIRRNPNDFAVTMIALIVMTLGVVVMVYFVPKSGMLVIKPE